MRTRQPRVYSVEVSRDSVTAGEAVGTLMVLVDTETSGIEKIMIAGHIGARPVATETLTEVEEERIQVDLVFPSEVTPALWDRVRISVSVYGTRGLILRRYVDLAVQELQE